ncbi:DUF4038 domain-containing protein [Candidatus Poribacteria bacterium]|nr:DUF4038 domain-containing protein [Candidatus Poribacteria bacterium]
MLGYGLEAQFFRFGSRHEDPLGAVDLRVDFTSPSGRKYSVNGFWDGGDMWRVGFAPDEPGGWSYTTHCNDASNAGLHGQGGEFQCVPYTGDNPLYQRGRIQLSENRRYLTCDDGQPFFWLACTAWNGALKSDEASWESYLTNRHAHGFTTIQFVMTQWRAALSDRQGQIAFTHLNGRLLVNPSFFQRLDQKFEAVNRHALVAAPVLLWAIWGETNPGYALPEPEAIPLARYMVARYGAYHVIWILAGDGDYRGEQAERWKRIGRAVFGGRHHRLVTMHPGGQQWVADEFREEAWYDIISYQSGHGDSGQ